MQRILSIQGGGERGIIPACALIEIERQVGKPVREIFDFIGGTSTGGLQTAAFAAGVPATKVLEFYTKSGPEIFKPHADIDRKYNLLANGRQFDAHHIYDTMKQALGPAATWKINDSPVKILITVASQPGDACWFVKDSPTNARTTGNYNLLDVSVATACATTYFDPWFIPNWGYGADGGCASMADPVLDVCVEAFSGYKCYGDIDPKEAMVISLGTGYYTSPPLPPGKYQAPPGNILQRVGWIAGSLVGSSKTRSQMEVDRCWPGVCQVFNPPIPFDYDEADVHDSTIAALLKAGQAQANSVDWKKVLGYAA